MKIEKKLEFSISKQSLDIRNLSQCNPGSPNAKQSGNTQLNTCSADPDGPSSPVPQFYKNGYHHSNSALLRSSTITRTQMCWAGRVPTAMKVDLFPEGCSELGGSIMGWEQHVPLSLWQLMVSWDCSGTAQANVLMESPKGSSEAHTWKYGFVDSQTSWELSLALRMKNSIGITRERVELSMLQGNKCCGWKSCAECLLLGIAWLGGPGWSIPAQVGWSSKLGTCTCSASTDITHAKFLLTAKEELPIA